VPTIREDIRNTPRIFGPKGVVRSYLLCERHDDDYFGGHDWLEAKRAARIREDLIAARVPAVAEGDE
jgi:hypothetical protein